MKRLNVLVLLWGVIVLETGPLRAAVFTWNAAAAGSAWNDIANWGNVAVPGSADVAQFAAGSYSAAASTPTLSATANLGGIWDTGAGAIAVGGSALTLYGATINGNVATGIELDATSGPLTVNAGLVATQTQTWINNSANALTLAGNVNDSASLYLWGSGSFNQTSAAVSISGSGANGILYVGYNSAAMSYTSSATYNLSGGSLNVGTEYVGYSSGSSIFTQSGGTNSLVQGIAVGVDSVSAAYNLQGGLLTAPNETIGSDTSGTSIFTQSAGTNSAGGLTVGFFTYGPAATYNLVGGLLNLSGLKSNNGSAAFNFGGGTLGALAPWSSSLNMTLTGSGGNATLDTTGGNIGLTGVLSGSGGLNKVGPGTLTLSASNGYTGITLVSAGTLSLTNTAALSGSTFDTSGSGSLNFGALTAATFGGLQGSGNLKLNNATPAVVSLSVGANNANTTFAGALISSGSLTKIGAGALTLTGSNVYSGSTTVSGGVLQLSAGQLSSPTQYVGYSTTGSFVQSGGTNLVSGNLYVGFGLSGSYSLSGGLLSETGIFPYEEVGNQISASFTQSGGTNSASGVYLGNNITGMGTYNLNGGLLALGAGAVTKGVGSATFNLGGGTLAASSPWSSSLNMNLTGAGAPGTVDTTGGSISLSGVLSGPGGLTKAGPGTLTLSGGNQYGGATSVNGGTLAFSGSGRSEFAGAITVGATPGNSGALVFGGSSVASFLAVTDGSFSVNWGSTLLIQGSTAVAVNGDLKLGGMDTGSSGTAVQSGGTLNVNGFDPGNQDRALVVGEYPGASSAYTLSGGLLNVTAGATFVPYHSDLGSLNISGGTANLAGIVFGDSSGPFSGTGQLNLSGSGVLNVGAGGMSVAPSYFAIVNISGGTLGAIAPWSSSLNMTLTGSGGNSTIDTSGGSICLSGEMTGNGELTKVGAGSLVLSGSSNYSGGTIVEAGTLIATNGEALPDGSSVIVGNLTLFGKAAAASIAVAGGSGLNEAAPVPEPGSMALTAAAVAGLWSWRRRLVIRLKRPSSASRR